MLYVIHKYCLEKKWNTYNTACIACIILDTMVFEIHESIWTIFLILCNVSKSSKYKMAAQKLYLYLNIGQLLVIPHPAVPVTMYLNGLNF